MALSASTSCMTFNQNIKLQNADYPEISFEQFIGLISIADKVGKQFIVINPHIFNDYVIHSGEKPKHPLLVQEEIMEEEFELNDIWLMYHACSEEAEIIDHQYCFRFRAAGGL